MIFHLFNLIHVSAFDVDDLDEPVRARLPILIIQMNRAKGTKAEKGETQTGFGFGLGVKCMTKFPKLQAK